MKTIKLLAAALLIIGFIAGCKDDDEKTKSELLLGTWTMTAATATDTSGTVIDLFNTFFPTCQKDDKFIFQSGGTFISDEGATKCDSTAAQQTSGTWTLTNEETVLNIYKDDTTSLTLIQLDDDVLKGSFTEGSGGTITATLGKN